MSKVVVTGGAGFIGSHVAEFYAQQGWSVLCFDNLSRFKLLGKNQEAYELNQKFSQGLPGTSFIEGDIRDYGLMLRIMQDANLVVHTAAQTAVTTSMIRPLDDFSANALGTLTVLEAARNTSPSPTVIICSTNKVYGKRVNELKIIEQPTRYAFETEYELGVPETLGIDLCEHTPYGCSKLTADIYAQDYGSIYGLRVGIFRMSCIYGTRQWGTEDQGWLAWFIIATLLGHEITIYGDGKQIRDILYVTDLVKAYDAFFNSDMPYGVFNTGGGPQNTVSLLELLDIIGSQTGKRTRIRFADWRPSDQLVYISDISKLKSYLGWQPDVHPGEGIQRLIDWVNKHLDKLSTVYPIH